MTPNPAQTIVDYLDGKTFAGLLVLRGITIFQGPKWMFPDQTQAPCVFVLNTGGAGNEAYLTPSRRLNSVQSVQVMFRGNRDSFDASEAQARAIHDALQYTVLPGFVATYPIDSTASFVGDDESGHPSFSSNFELHATVELGEQIPGGN